MKDKFIFPKKVEIMVGGKYRIERKIGEGSFSEIYEGTDIFSNTQVAIKLEHISIKYPQVISESKILKSIKGIGIPELYWAGISGEVIF